MVCVKITVKSIIPSVAHPSEPKQTIKNDTVSDLLRNLFVPQEKKDLLLNLVPVLLNSG